MKTWGREFFPSLWTTEPPRGGERTSSDAQGVCPEESALFELTHVTGSDIDEALEKGPQGTVLGGLRQGDKSGRETRKGVVARIRTHGFIQVPERGAGKLLHVVGWKPQLLLPPVVASPPEDKEPGHQSGWAAPAGRRLAWTH